MTKHEREKIRSDIALACVLEKRSQCIPVITRNMSLGGVLLSVEGGVTELTKAEAIKIGDTVDCRFLIQSCILKLAGIVTRKERDICAVKFLSPKTADVMYLRAIMSGKIAVRDAW